MVKKTWITGPCPPDLFAYTDAHHHFRRRRSATILRVHQPGLFRRGLSHSGCLSFFSLHTSAAMSANNHAEPRLHPSSSTHWKPEAADQSQPRLISRTLNAMTIMPSCRSIVPALAAFCSLGLASERFSLLCWWVFSAELLLPFVRLSVVSESLWKRFSGQLRALLGVRDNFYSFFLFTAQRGPSRPRRKLLPGKAQL